MLACLRIFQWRTLFFLVLTLLFNGLATNIGDGSAATTHVSLPSSTVTTTTPSPPSSSSSSSPSSQTRSLTKEEDDPTHYCPSNTSCSKLGARCVDWVQPENHSCVYGREYQTTCTAKAKVNCTGERLFNCKHQCRFCYQLDPWKYRCNASTCPINIPRKTWPARPFYIALCSARDDILCMGHRDFYKQVDCNWTSGYKWTTAMILSITLGGFGADRFYLGLWREGIGKLFSFGGLGVWTLIDVILIAVGYVGPADGSLYI